MLDPAGGVGGLKLPPHSDEAEQAILGGLLLENSAWDRIADVVLAGDFYRQDHRHILDAIGRLISENKPADIVTTAELLSISGRLDQVGGLAYLAALAGNTASAANIRRYAEIVRERSMLRKLVSITSEIADIAHTPAGRTAADILDEAESKIFQIAEGTARSGDFQAMNPLLKACVDRIDVLHNQGNQDGITGVPTGFADLDRMTAGFQPGDLIIIAGRPSMGKTSLALNVAENVALDTGLPVGVFSMEMGASQLVMRMLGSVAHIDHHKLRTGQGLSDEDWAAMSDAIGRLNDAPIHIDETPALNPGELRSRARRLMRQAGGKMGLIVVDYLQLMSASSSGENRATEVSEISRSLKALAKELKCPVVALSQLNRSLEQRADKRPVMSDLRESGAIEQDADLILFIYRDEVYNPDSEQKGTAEIIVAKQRNGPIGKVHLAFLGKYTKFANHAFSGHNPA